MASRSKFDVASPERADGGGEGSTHKSMARCNAPTTQYRGLDSEQLNSILAPPD